MRARAPTTSASRAAESRETVSELRDHGDGLPGWVTLPVAIFGLTDRGDIFDGAALTMILVAATLALLLALESAPIRSAAARR